MIDEKDLEIARLRGQLEARQLSQAPKGGAAVGTLKVLATLAAVAIGGLVLLVAIGNALPDQTPTPEERAAAIERRCGSSQACVWRELERDARR